MDAFDALAVSSSVPFARRLNGAELRAVLASGVVPPDVWPHLDRAMNELPIEMLAAVVFAHPAGVARDAAVAALRRTAAAVGATERIEAWLAG